MTQTYKDKYTPQELSQYMAGLNSLLSDHGYAESFVLDKGLFQGKEVDKLVLCHQKNKEKKIELITFEYDEFFLFFRDVGLTCIQGDIEDAEDFQGMLEESFPMIQKVLDGKVIIFRERDKKGGLARTGFVFLELDVDVFDYGKKEKSFLAKANLQYSLWKGVVSENIKLFVIGSAFTKMPEISKKEMAHYYANDKSTLWRGAPSKIGAMMTTMEIVLWEFVAFSALCSLGLLNNWKTFLVLEAAVVFLMCVLLIPILAYKTHKTSKNEFDYYLITNRGIIIVFEAMVVRYGYDDILNMKIKYAFYERNQKHGTIKIKVRGQRLTSLNNHLRSIPEPEKVYRIIQERIDSLSEQAS